MPGRWADEKADTLLKTALLEADGEDSRVIGGLRVNARTDEDWQWSECGAGCWDVDIS